MIEQIQNIWSNERATANCECGGKFEVFQQALCFNKEESRMEDHMYSRCYKCNAERTNVYPLTSVQMKSMAAEYLKEDKESRPISGASFAPTRSPNESVN